MAGCPPCPECGGVLVIDRGAERGTLIAPPFFVIGVSRLEERRVPCAVAFCSVCEFAIEVSRFALDTYISEGFR